MLNIIEIPHQGPRRDWSAIDREDFCLKVLASNARADIDHEATYEELVQWLRSDLRDLIIQECPHFPNEE